MKFLKVLAVFLAAVPALAQTPDLDEVLDKARRPTRGSAGIR
jgi:hypothetical protein